MERQADELQGDRHPLSIFI